MSSINTTDLLSQLSGCLDTGITHEKWEEFWGMLERSDANAIPFDDVRIIIEALAMARAYIVKYEQLCLFAGDEIEKRDTGGLRMIKKSSPSNDFENQKNNTAKNNENCFENQQT